MKSLVSVVLCTCNGEKYIKEQIDSILNQSYPIHELVIQDDASNDSTINILSQYRSNPKVKIYINIKAIKIEKLVIITPFSALSIRTVVRLPGPTIIGKAIGITALFI